MRARPHAHEGSPSWSAGSHQFARLRWDDDGRELLQTWTGDMTLERRAGGAAATAFPVVHTFRYRVTSWAVLERLDRREVAELLLDSYAIRGGVRAARRSTRRLTSPASDPSAVGSTNGS